jgi:glucosylglycerate phosphorylase
MLSLAGVPGIYIHSLFGSRNWQDGVKQTSRARTINRRKFQRATLETELTDLHSVTHRVFHAYRDLLRARCSHPAFHPQATQQLLSLADGVFGLVRSPPGGETLVVLINVTGNPQPVTLDLAALALPVVPWRDLITHQQFSATQDRLSLELAGYQTLWLEP